MRYRVAIVGCGRIAGTIDDETTGDNSWVEYLPHSHAAAYRLVEKTILWAAADTSPEQLARFRERYGVDRCYADYREMIDKERPDIVSVTTPANLHAEVTVYAAEHGVKGVYCEKAMACSLEEADRMKETCARNGVAFNLGTVRRYHPGFEKMRELILSGSIGAPRTLVHPVSASLLLHTGSHCFDTILYLLGDPDVDYVQAQLGSFIHQDGTASSPHYDACANRFAGRNLWESDPAVRHAYVHFQNDIQAQVVMAPERYDFHVFCEEGSVSVLQDGKRWELCRHVAGRTFEYPAFPFFPKRSPTVHCINDLIGSIESRNLGHLEVSHRGMEIAIAAAQSHIEGGRSIQLPVTNRGLVVPNH